MDPRADLSSTALRLDEAVHLGHAMVDGLAKQLGVRALAIKGPVGVAQGVISAHASIDVDVLVEPAGHQVLCAAMGDLGWFVDSALTRPSVLPRHSTTLNHRQWPCQVDVHHRFPGLLADPEVAFDVLWSRRETLTIAHTLVTCCDRGGSVVIAGVNALRDNRSDVVASLVDQVQSVFDAEAVHDLAELAERVGAAQTLAPVLQAVGAPVAAPSSGALADLEAWHVRSAAGRVGSARWVLELKRAPMRRWPALTWRAVVLAEDEIVRRYPSAGRGWLHLQLARARRASLGLRQLPRAVRLVREAGRKRRSVERLGQPDDG